MKTPVKNPSRLGQCGDVKIVDWIILNFGTD